MEEGGFQPSRLFLFCRLFLFLSVSLVLFEVLYSLFSSSFFLVFTHFLPPKMDTLSTPLRVFPPFVSLTLLFCLPLSPIIYPCPAVKPRSRPEFCPPGR